MQSAYGETYECCKWLKIELMPCNEDAYKLLKHSLPGCQWKKGQDGWYRMSYNPADVAAVMGALGISDPAVFEAVTATIGAFEEEHVG